MVTKRIEWVDITKGIAIFLMVCGHTSIPQSVSNWIWSFHMPLFFIMSGALFNATKYPNFSCFLLKRVHTLVIPYIILSFVVLLINDNVLIVEWLYKGWNNGYALWFIPVLFFAEIYSYFIIHYGHGVKKVLFWAGIIGSTGYLLSFYGIRFWYNVDVSFYACFFYLIGYLLRNRLKQGLFCNWFLIFGILFLKIVLSQICPRTDMASNTCGWYGLNAFNALLGTLAIIMIAKKDVLKKNNIVRTFFVWAGQNTLVILGLSQVVNVQLKFVMENMPMPEFINFIIRHFSLWIILWLLSVIIRKYLPEVIGQKRDR